MKEAGLRHRWSLPRARNSPAPRSGSRASSRSDIRRMRAASLCGMPAGPAGEGLGKLAADVLDLGQQREGLDVVGPLGEAGLDLDLGLVELANRHQHRRDLEAILPRDRRDCLHGRILERYGYV